MRYGHGAEWHRLMILAAICLVVGLITGYFFVALMIGGFIYLAYHCYQFNCLVLWLRNPSLKTLPEAGGLWGEVFDNLGRQQRREQKEKGRLRNIIERINATTAAIDDAIVILDKKKNINWWNQGAVSMLGLKPRDTGNSLINYIRHPQFVSYLDEEDFDVPIQLPSHLNHELHLEYQLTLFGDDEALMVVRDVTRVYKLEQMRKDFVANVSHELRTPLTVIRGYLETLEAFSIEDERKNQLWQKALNNMQHQTVRMTDLINDLTMLSKLETDKSVSQQKALQLKPLLDMICHEARAISGEKQHEIILSCDDNYFLVANDSEFHSAISNLVTNAVKYSEAGKKIILSAERLPSNDLAIIIEDEGVGIEAQHINRLTERFYRVDASRSIATGGTGLGLAIVKHILFRHEAHLKIDSEYGKGSRFSCVFPEYRVSEKPASAKTIAE